MKKGIVFTLVSSIFFTACGVSVKDNNPNSYSYSEQSNNNNANSNDANSPCTRKVFNGSIVDGYIKGAKVCFDFNNNNQCDSNEPQSVSDEFGEYQIKYSKKANPNSTIIAYGGIDTDTNSEFKGILKTTAKISNISAATTLVANLVQLGVDQELAKEKVANLLGISTSSVTKDPIKEYSSNPNVFKANYKILKLVETASNKNNKHSIDKAFKDLAKELKNSSDLDDIIDKTYNYKTSQTLKEMQNIIDNDLNELNDRLDYVNSLKNLALKAKIKISQNLDDSLDSLIDIIKGCAIDENLDDSGYKDIAPYIEVKYSADSSVESIERAFNKAREEDVTVGKKLKLPHKLIWENMSQELQALYILNKERVDRGLKPFEGVVKMELNFNGSSAKTLAQVSQGYANLLYKSTEFSHYLDGSPIDRINSIPSLKNSKEYIPYVESLYMSANSHKLEKYPLIKAIYYWLYVDSKANWKHRDMCLMRVGYDNFGKKGAEGILSFGLAFGTKNPKYKDWYTTFVVMNAYNPSSNWQGEYKSVPLCLSF